VLRIRGRKARVGIGAVDQVDRDEGIGRRRKSGTGSINDATHAKLSSNTSLGPAQYLLARAQKINHGVDGRLQNGSFGLGRARPTAAGLPLPSASCDNSLQRRLGVAVAKVFELRSHARMTA
jgi:hypothetical protein